MVERFRTDAHELVGRVAVITGVLEGESGTDALLLARRGASIVLNDIGADVTGSGSDGWVAQASCGDEIVSADGQAVASTGDISTPKGGSWPGWTQVTVPTRRWPADTTITSVVAAALRSRAAAWRITTSSLGAGGMSRVR